MHCYKDLQIKSVIQKKKPNYKHGDTHKKGIEKGEYNEEN